MADTDFKKSPAQCFVRSSAQARNNIIATTLYSTVTAMVPLFGFGSFAASQSSIPGFMSPATSEIPNINFNSVWPQVYTKLVEKWVDSGGTKTITTLYTQYTDMLPTTTVSGTASGGATVATSVSPSLLTVTYVGGVYTATLSGTLLDPTAPGPFNPVAGTNGWAALTAVCNSFLAGFTIPIFNETSFPPPVFASVSSSYAPLSSGPPGPYQPGGYVMAAMNGMPFYYCSGGNTAMLEIFPVILDDPNDVDFGTAIPNCGFCVCAKSLWNIASGDTAHEHLYVQSVNPTNLLVTGAIAAATTTFPATLSLPLNQTFIPSDIANNASLVYGILGFTSTPA